jgi:hypothetical protein
MQRMVGKNKSLLDITSYYTYEAMSIQKKGKTIIFIL